jgi:hypothetical protein
LKVMTHNDAVLAVTSPEWAVRKGYSIVKRERYSGSTKSARIS